jgi:hypothetical protein
MELELKDGYNRNRNLATAVFPDNNLPLPVDNTLVGKILPPRSRTRSSTASRAATRAATKASLKKRSKSVGKDPNRASLLYHPPSDWSEKNISDWLNTIATALETVYREENYGKKLGSYISLDGTRVDPPKKSWSHKQSGSPLKGSKISRKPDVILVDSDLKQVVWQNVQGLCEVTRTELPKNTTIKDTIFQKSYIMMTSQDNRCFVPSLSFSCDSFTFTVCDRSGAVYSDTQKVKAYPAILLRIIVGMMFGRPSTIGYDETIECDDAGKATNIIVEGRRYQVQEELFKSKSMRGRATRCWGVWNGEDEHPVIKDSWVDLRREQNEIETLKYIQAQGLASDKGLPQLVHGEDVPLPCGGYDSKPICVKDYTSRRRTDDWEEIRVHRRLVMGPKGRHIIAFESLKELIGAFIDVVEGSSFR